MSIATHLQDAAAFLNQENWEDAARLLADLLQSDALPRGYPARNLVSAAHGMLMLLPEPHIAHAARCLKRAGEVLTAVQPGQAQL